MCCRSSRFCSDLIVASLYRGAIRAHFQCDIAFIAHAVALTQVLRRLLSLGADIVRILRSRPVPQGGDLRLHLQAQVLPAFLLCAAIHITGAILSIRPDGEIPPLQQFFLELLDAACAGSAARRCVRLKHLLSAVTPSPLQCRCRRCPRHFPASHS